MSTQPVDSIAALVPAIEKWEDAHRRYGQRKGCKPLEEQQQMVSLLGLASPELQGHLELNLGRLTSYKLSFTDVDVNTGSSTISSRTQFKFSCLVLK